MGNFEIYAKYERLKKLDTNFNRALLINLFALGLVLLCCDLKYEVSDDFVMSTIVSGAYGKGRNPHLIFSNIFLGYILLPFYQLVLRNAYSGRFYIFNDSYFFFDREIRKNESDYALCLFNFIFFQ